MTTWEVLRWDDSDDESGAWVIGGTFETESNCSLGYDAASELGKRFGTGSFLLLCQESSRFTEIQIAARQEFYEVSVEEALPEAADPLSAAAVMDRDG